MPQNKRKSSDDDVVFVSSQPRKTPCPSRPYEGPYSQQERNAWVVPDEEEELTREILNLTQDSFDDVTYQGYELYGTRRPARAP